MKKRESKEQLKERLERELWTLENDIRHDIKVTRFFIRTRDRFYMSLAADYSVYYKYEQLFELFQQLEKKALIAELSTKDAKIALSQVKAVKNAKNKASNDEAYKNSPAFIRVLYYYDAIKEVLD